MTEPNLKTDEDILRETEPFKSPSDDSKYAIHDACREGKCNAQSPALHAYYAPLATPYPLSPETVYNALSMQSPQLNLS